MSLTPAVDPAIIGFERAMREFKDKLKDDALYREILTTRSIDQVYDLAAKIQDEQGKTGHLRHLSKIQKYLEKMRLYADAIDTFVQVKPDILALIWGPIKLLIQWTSTLSKSQDAIAKITAEIGDLLPQFTDMAALFSHNTRLNDIMYLFFQDILDFYLITLKFFSMSRWKYFFESLWPKQKDRIDLVQTHIERHAMLMSTEVRLEHIREEHNARQRALDHFEKSDRESTEQDFHRIQTNISPEFYHQKLAAISATLCKGTGKWLLQGDKFIQWLDPSNATSKILWLEGIPGAGKTFLAGTVVNKCQSLGNRTIYSFLSHIHAANTSALSVFHSLIFQLASGSNDLKAALCQSDRENINSSLISAVSLLKLLLDCAGVTYLVIDGADEIEKAQRQRLFAELVGLSEKCDSARILVCSRAESDIEHVLEGWPRIRVDDHNSGSIQAFVNRQSSEWLATKDFLEHDRCEVKALLAPVASTAKGMFLYARVLLSGLELLSDIREVRMEFEVLPATLHDAYARIFRRINSISSARAQLNAKRLIGFVGCSPTPLAVYELEQLLTLDLEDDAVAHPVSSSLNPVELCGPIVEVLDGYVQFVHFTVKEYLFAPEIEGSMKKSEMTLQLTNFCLDYLCQDHHDPESTADEIEERIMWGSYRLHIYAGTMWLSLVEKCLSDTGPMSSEFLEGLERFAAHRLVAKPHEEGTSPHPTNQKFVKLLDQLPNAYPPLVRAMEFRRKCDSSGFQITNGEQWKALDPLDTSDISISIHQAFDSLLCESASHTDNCCQYLVLRRLYGPRLFKCPYLGCPFRRQGFETRTMQRSHTAHHDKPWKCAVEGCEYFEIGFLSKRMRDAHFNGFHTKDQTQQPLQATGIQNPDKDDIQPLLFDLVRADRTIEMKQIIHHFKAMGKDCQDSLIQIAAISASGMMVGMLLEASTQQQPEKFLILLYFAVRSQNIDVVKWILGNLDTKSAFSNYYPEFLIQGSGFSVANGGGISRGCVTWGTILQLVLESDSEELFQCLLQELVREFTTKKTREKTSPAARAMDTAIVRATARRLDREQRLLILWNKLPQTFTKRPYSKALRYVAETCWSIPLAKALLRYGADINFTGSRTGGYRAPIHCALRKSSSETAEFARFLLYMGASPDVTARKSNIKSVKEERGAREISQWIGMDWDELVAKVKADKEAGICPAEYMLTASDIAL